MTKAQLPRPKESPNSKSQSIRSVLINGIFLVIGPWTLVISLRLLPRHLPARQYNSRVDSTTFRHSYRVTYADCTVGNHVYYSRYLDLLEAARGEFFRHLGAPFRQLQEQEIIFPVVECHLRYKAPARYDDVLGIELWISAAMGIRLNFAYRIVNEADALILEGETCHVCTGMNEKPKRLPEELVKLLAPYVQAG